MTLDHAAMEARQRLDAALRKTAMVQTLRLKGHLLASVPDPLLADASRPFMPYIPTLARRRSRHDRRTR